MRKLFLLFSMMIIAFLMAMPGLGWADTVTSVGTDCKNDAQFASNYKANMSSQVVAKRNNIYGVNNQLAKIEADLFACLDGIDLGYDLGPLFHNPLGFLEAALEAAFWKMIETLLDTICHTIVNAVNSVINQIVSAVESLANFACIPMPNLGLGTIDLHLPHVPCNGTPLIPGSAIITRTSPSSGSSTWRLLGRDAQ